MVEHVGTTVDDLKSDINGSNVLSGMQHITNAFAELSGDMGNLLGSLGVDNDVSDVFGKMEDTSKGLSSAVGHVGNLVGNLVMDSNSKDPLNGVFSSVSHVAGSIADLSGDLNGVLNAFDVDNHIASILEQIENTSVKAAHVVTTIGQNTQAVMQSFQTAGGAGGLVVAAGIIGGNALKSNSLIGRRKRSPEEALLRDLSQKLSVALHREKRRAKQRPKSNPALSKMSQMDKNSKRVIAAVAMTGIKRSMRLVIMYKTRCTKTGQFIPIYIMYL